MYWGGKTKKYLPVVDSLVNNERIVSQGPDFFNYYKKYPNYVPNGHPNVAGTTQMARLWGLSMVYPQNFVVSENNGSVDLSWSSLPYELGIGGYKIKYGTAPDNYSQVVDVGNSLSKEITGLINGQTYYFTVSAYDNDPKFVSESAKAPAKDLTYLYTPETPATTPVVVEDEPIAELAPVIIPEIKNPFVNPPIIDSEQDQETDPVLPPNNITKKEKRKEKYQNIFKNMFKKEKTDNQNPTNNTNAENQATKKSSMKELLARLKNKNNR